MNREKIKSYYQLFKPGLALNIVITEIPVFIYHKVNSFEIIVYTTIGTLLCAMSSFAYNQILEQSKDKLMQRTQERYLVRFKTNPYTIYLIASIMIGLGSFILGAYVGILPMVFSLIAFFNYIFIYTLWLKPRYTINTLIGGISGAIGPLIAESSVLQTISEYGIFLFLLLFLWQPPHFWALAIFRKEDYEKADFAMLPIKKGIDFTINQMILYLSLFLLIMIIGFLQNIVSYIFLIPSSLYALFLIYKTFQSKQSKNLSIFRNIFFHTIFHNILWHFCLILDATL